MFLRSRAPARVTPGDRNHRQQQLLKALPKDRKRSVIARMKDAFEKHLEQTKRHVEKAEELFEQPGESPKGKFCHGMKGLIAEGSEILIEDGEDSVLDAGIIVTAQKVEHEIASYGSVRTFANLLCKDEEARLCNLRSMENLKQTRF